MASLDVLSDFKETEFLMKWEIIGNCRMYNSVIAFNMYIYISFISTVCFGVRVNYCQTNHERQSCYMYFTN